MKLVRSMFPLLVILLQTACCSAKPPVAVASTAIAETDLATMSPYVNQVVTGSHWQENGRSGRYRMVAACGGWEHVRCEYFLQWVQGPEDQGQDPKVVASVSVPELDRYLSYAATILFSAEGVSPCIISVTLVNEIKDSPTTISIQPAGIGSYIVTSNVARKQAL